MTGERREIRPATEEDVPAMLEIYAPLVVASATSFELVPPDLGAMQDRLRATVPPDAWLVMDLDGVVAGYASSTGFRGRPAYARTRETTIYVHPGHRRRGIASELMDRLVAVLAERGIHRIVAGISLPNDASVALHERLGFTHVGTFTEVGAKFGRWHDVGFWQLEVDGGSDQAPGSPER